MHVILLCRSATDVLRHRQQLLEDAGVACKIVADDETLVTDAELRAAGWTDLNTATVGKDITAWERATFWAHKQCYDYTWFIEDDVFWTRTDHLVNLLKSYNRSNADLVAQSIAMRPEDAPHWPHWRQSLFKQHEQCATFNPLCRLSRALLQEIANLAQEHRRLCFLEVLFASACKSARLRYATLASERLLLRYRPSFSTAELDVLRKNSYVRIFHPVKAAVR